MHETPCSNNFDHYQLGHSEACVVFSHALNASIQVGDRLYFSIPRSSQIGVNHPHYNTYTKPIYLGPITHIEYEDPNGSGESMVCVAKANANTIYNEVCQDLPPDCDCDVYYFFSKDNEANLTSLIGYYADVEVRNNSREKAELFQITADFAESSR